MSILSYIIYEFIIYSVKMKATTIYATLFELSRSIELWFVPAILA